MRHRIEQVVGFVAFASMFLIGWLPTSFYAVGLAVTAALLVAFHGVPWVRRRGWRRSEPWPWDVPPSVVDDDGTFWTAHQ